MKVKSENPATENTERQEAVLQVASKIHNCVNLRWFLATPKLAVAMLKLAFSAISVFSVAN
jgi:hypothetical protein